MKRYIPSILFLLVFSAALLGLNPTFYLDDSPETVTASALWGIPHPPGYPLHTMVGYLFTKLPLGLVAFRVNLISALLMSLAALLLFLLLRDRFRLSAPLAFGFGLLWAAGASSYSFALSAKGGIYQLTAVFLAAVLWALLSRRLHLAAFLYGLSLANHWMSMAAYGPGLFFLAYGLVREKENGKRETWTALSFALLGFSLYILLPLRAIADPAVNWGDPRTWELFKFNFARTQYSGSEMTGGISAWARQWAYLLKAAFLEFPGPSLLAVLGISLGWKRDRNRALGMVLAWGGLFLAVGLFLDLSKDRMYLIDAYGLSSHILVLLFAGWGLGLWLEGRPQWSQGTTVLLLGLSLGLLVFRFTGLRQDRYTWVYDYTLNAMQPVPRGSLFYCKGDGLVFPGWYFQFLEGRRMDLVAVGVDGLPMEWIRKRLAGMHPGLKVPFPRGFVGNESVAPMARQIVYDNRDRELYFTYNRIKDRSLPEVNMVPYGLAQKGHIPPDKPVLDEGRAKYLWGIARMRGLGQGAPRMDGKTRQTILKDYAVSRNSLGIYYEDWADGTKAAAGVLPPKDNVRLFEECLGNFLWTQRLYPEDAEFAYNVGNAMFHLGRYQDAGAYYEKCVKIDPTYADAYYNWGVAAVQLRLFPQAGQFIEKALELKPGKIEAQAAMKYLVDNGLYKPKK